MTPLEILFASLLILSAIFTIAMLIYYRFFRRHTRERFAFLVFLSNATLASTVVMMLLSGQELTRRLFAQVEMMFGYAPQHYEPSFGDKGLAIAVMLALMYLGLLLHRNWPGEKSTREHEAAAAGVTPGVLSGTLVALAAHLGKTKLEAYKPSRRGQMRSAIPVPLSSGKAWHIWAARVLQLSPPYFRIDEHDHWYPEERLYISTCGSNRIAAALMCCDAKPEPHSIGNAIHFAKSAIGDQLRFLVAINAGGSERTTDVLNGQRVEYRYRPEMCDSLIDISVYADAIKHEYEALEIAEGYPFRLKDVYVPSAAVEMSHGRAIEIPNVEEYVQSWVRERGLRHLAILAEFGQGKSVLALRVAYRLLFEEPEGQRIPILVRLGGRSPRNQSTLGLLGDWAAPYRINRRPYYFFTRQEGWSSSSTLSMK